MTKEEIFDLIKDAGYGVLATTEGDQPKARPMMPCLTDEGDLLVAVLSKSRCIEQVKANPKVEMCYIDRNMHFARISGLAEISEDAEKKEQVWNYVPMLRQYFTGPEDQNFVLIHIKSESVEAMTPHQKEPDQVSLK